jgi:Phage integrase family.
MVPSTVRIPMESPYVFPAGALFLGVEPLTDFSKRGQGDDQARDENGVRLSYATWLVSSGVPINDVAQTMGHEQTSTTLNLYTHSNRERDRRVLRAFAAFSLPLGAEDSAK